MLKGIKKLAFLLSLLGMSVISADYSYAAAPSANTMAIAGDDDQKRGKGRGGDQNKGDKNKGDRDDRHKQRDGDSESRRPQNRSDDNSRHQQRRSDDDSRRQQRDSDRGSRRQQSRSDDNSRRQQRQSDDSSRRQQWESDRNSLQQQRRSDDNSRRQQNRNDDNSLRQPRQSDRRGVYVSPPNSWNLNQIRNGQRQGAHRYGREQGKYFKEQYKDQRKAQRRYSRDQSRFYGQNVFIQQQPIYYGYDNNGYDSGNGSGWKDMILRSIIANVLGGGGSDMGGLNGLINQNRYVQNVPNYAYYDDGYNQQYQRRPAPSYQSTGYGYNQSDYGYNEPEYYGSNSGLLGSLPIAEIIQQFTGDNEFVSQLIGNFVSQGYDQGYMAGEYARDDGYQNAVYNDPYRYENGLCDPYSASLGQNREYLSQGYELGYRDAMEGGNGYDPMTEGNTDLVSALLNSVLSGV